MNGNKFVGKSKFINKI